MAPSATSVGTDRTKSTTTTTKTQRASSSVNGLLAVTLTCHELAISQRPKSMSTAQRATAGLSGLGPTEAPIMSGRSKLLSTKAGSPTSILVNFGMYTVFRLGTKK